MGDMLLSYASNLHPQKTLTVFCGHTHDPARFKFQDNLIAICSPAEYGKPEPGELVNIL